MLRDYEILYIVRPELDEEQLQSAIGSVDRLIQSVGGQGQKTDIWGRRRLAYEVDRLREGHYVLTDFQLDPQRMPEMEATLKISDTVFRHLIVRKPDAARTTGGKAGKQIPEPAEVAESVPGADEAVGASKLSPATATTSEA
ncbi:MAG: 30S ribosomal protein S6 [Candidatus Dormibacteraeota bacterium]|uniref:Small ribosomal subunit protein bS6 n=1 Tax=Candidatus Dormiibacter inghamiae TaxID=3127013 RepID=A0A934ND26_9BACT|nr:30S ribosomal protein S6 [Candidatus Dormibacteraeota bacterium]MBJ7605745.1 30S ribosomal protein S6 [Candidatus Dormibacteraeota bacterium]